MFSFGCAEDFQDFGLMHVLLGGKKAGKCSTMYGGGFIRAQRCLPQLVPRATTVTTMQLGTSALGLQLNHRKSMVKASGFLCLCLFTSHPFICLSLL